MIEKVELKNRAPPEEKRVPDSEIESNYIQFLHGEKVHKSNVCEKIKQYKNDLMFSKTRVLILIS